MSILERVFGFPPALVPLRTPQAKADTTAEDLGPSVVAGELVRTSVSGISTADPSQDGGCLRKWHVQKVLGIDPPKTRAQDEGTAAHSQIEHYLKTGEDVLGPLVRVGKHLIPQPDPRLQVEAKFTTKGRELTAAGIPLVGFIDVINPTGFYLDGEGNLRPEAPHTQEVIDWKTTKSIDQYAKTGSALIRTVQMPGYAEMMFRRDPTLEQIRLSHVYFQTGRKRAARKATVVVDRLTVQRRWSTVESVVRSMIDAAKEADPAKVEASFTACDAFGGCPFRASSHCPRTAQVTLDVIFGTGAAMSLLDRMKQQAAAQATTSAPAPAPAPAPVAVAAPPPAPAPVAVAAPPPAPAPALAPASSRLDDLKARQAAELARLVAEEEAAKAPAPAPAPAAIKAGEARQGRRYWVEFSTGPVLVSYICLTKGGHSFAKLKPDGTNDEGTIILSDPATPIYPADNVLPPDAPASGTVAPAAEPIPVGTVVPVNVAAAALEVAPTPAPAPEEAKRPRGRPRKTAVEATLTPAPADAPVPAPVAAPSAPAVMVREPLVPTTFPAPVSVVLYIDAVPTKGAATAINLEDMARSACKVLCEEYKAADVRCAPSDSPLGFGKWKGALAALVRANTPAGGVYYIVGTRQNEIAATVAEAFADLADVVVRGVL